MADFTLERRIAVLADLSTRFDRISVPYKSVNDTPIEAAIFVPKAISSSTETEQVPVLVHFHGGALIMGANPEPYFLADWVRDLAYTTPAIFVSPAYRLIPESRAVDALEDIGDFWTWLHAHLPAAVHTQWPHLTPDLDRVVAVGESAGGYLSMQSALLFNRTAKLRATIAQYPGLYPDLKAFGERPKNADPKADVIVEEYVKNIKPGAIRTSSTWPEVTEFLFAVLGNGLLEQMYGEDKEGKMTLRYALEHAEEVPPPVWVIQGSEDHIVVQSRVDELVETVRQARPRATIKYTVKPGDHGFDVPNKLDDDWVKEGVDFIKGYWL